MADRTTHAEAIDIIETVGHAHWVHVVGPIGCGKSSMLKTLAKRKPEFQAIHLDIPTMDFPDIFMPSVDKEKEESMLFLNRTFGKNDPRPKIYNYDEWTKGMEHIKVVTLQQLLHLSFGGWVAPEGTIRFSTGNLGDEGVGDTIMAHAQNRFIELELSKPTPNELIEYGYDNQWAPEILALIGEVPECLDDYRDMKDSDGKDEKERIMDNPYIHDPKATKGQFVTPRSLEAGSNSVKLFGANKNLKEPYARELMYRACAGAWGQALTDKFRTIMNTSDQLPRWQDVVDNPESTMLPKSGIAETILVNKAKSQVTRDSMSPFMTYLNRIESLETQCLFANLMYRSNKSQEIAMRNRLFNEWANENKWVWAGDKV